MTWRLAALAVAAGLVPWALAAAQPAGSPGDGTPVAPTAYEDRLIEGGTLALDDAGEGGTPYNAEGWPRFYRIDGVASYFDQQGLITRENGGRLFARLDTPQYGAITVDATARVGPGSFIATIVQRDLAFDHDWRANNALGVVTSLGIDLSRNQYRFYVPTFPTVGGTTEWIHDGDLQLQASIGQPGNYDGFRLSGFESLDGTLATVGAQWAFAPRWQAGVQFVNASGVDSPYAVDGNGKIDSNAVFAALTWNGDTTRLQANVLASDASTLGASVRATGLWLDGKTLWDKVTHNYGVFRLEPGLTWGYQPINNDLQGAYYRMAYQSLRWQVDGGVDYANSVSGRGTSGTYVTLNGRYQFNSRMGLGGNGGYLSNGGQTASLVSAYGDLVWSQGASRLAFSAARNNNVPASRAEQVQLDHTWNMPAGTRLTTSLTATQDRTDTVTNGDATVPGSTLRRFGLGVLGGGDITNNLSLDANLQYNVFSRSGTATGVYGNVNLNWRISSQWSVVGTYYDNRDDSAQLFVLDPLIPEIGQLPTQRNRAVFLMVRYEDRGGTQAVPIGGRPGSPAGAIAGTLFLDANDNGVREATEGGAANVTILLDGRFPTRTDEAGRFEFPFVAAGTHRISVIPDNLPLPWSVDNPRIEVQVNARSTANVEIPARRMR